MELTVSQEPGTLLAKATGPIDESARNQFRKYVHTCLAESGTNLVLDLSESRQITSQGLAHLVALVAYANSKSNRVILCGLTPHVEGVIAVTKLQRFFEIAPNVSEALARIRN